MDRVIRGARERSDRLSKKIDERYGKTRPFDSVRVPTEQMLYDYEQWFNSEQPLQDAQRYGFDAVQKFYETMEALKQRRMKNA